MATKGDKELKRNWPVTDGLTAQTTKQEGHIEKLEAQEGSNVPRRYRMGID